MPLLSIAQVAPFRPDALSWVMAALIVFVAANVMAFSVRYLAGDRNRGLHLSLVFMLAASVLTLVFADHLLVLLAAWAVSDLLLVRLMWHKREWIQARNSALLAARTFGLGLVALAAGFWLLADAAGSAYVHEIVRTPLASSNEATAGLMLIAVAAMTQSAILPFHRWLVSSLNSPTPVSALMHAGLVNGGGFLLVRFASLYLSQPGILHFLFVAGLLTAVTGTFWKLLQGDVKRMLACSTVGQMGFMLMQCGMGLFAAAVSHLCWHGLFKAYAFLNAGSVVREKRRTLHAAMISPAGYALASVAGIIGAWAFANTSGIAFSMSDTGGLMCGFAFMAAAQLALKVLELPASLLRTAAVPVAGLFAGASYGVSVRLVETAIEPLNANQAQPLDPIYLAGFALLAGVWLAMNVDLATKLKSRTAWKRLYVMALNASQPQPETVTATRTEYRI